jgi:hypothetical protein
MKPPAFELFNMYYLGLTPKFEARFYNLNSIGRHYNVSVQEVEAWLKGYKIPPEIFEHIDFNVAIAHGKAQELGLLGTPKEAEEFARTAFQEAVKALENYSDKAHFEDVNYDDIWGDEK